MRMIPFQFSISHVPGKDLTIADMLSRDPVVDPTSSDILQQEANTLISVILTSIPATEERIEEI